MMLYPSMSDLLKKVPNRYSLVNVAAKRARDISSAVEDDPESKLEEKAVSLALDDIINGRIIPVEKAPDEELELDGESDDQQTESETENAEEE